MAASKVVRQVTTSGGHEIGPYWTHRTGGTAFSISPRGDHHPDTLDGHKQQRTLGDVFRYKKPAFSISRQRSESASRGTRVFHVWTSPDIARRAGPGNGLPPHELFGQSESILESGGRGTSSLNRSQRLISSETEFRRAGRRRCGAVDRRGGPSLSHTFDHVRRYRSSLKRRGNGAFVGSFGFGLKNTR